MPVKVPLFVVVLLTLGVAQPAIADPVFLTYTIGGTFDDGGRFSGSFGYDPMSDKYAYGTDFPEFEGLPFGQFDVTTTPGTLNLATHYISQTFPNPQGYAGNGSPTSWGAGGGGHFVFQQFTINWANPLNAPDGAQFQPLLGGSESFFGGPCDPVNGCSPKVRQIVDGFVMQASAPAPVPLPAAVWLLASALGGIMPIRRRRGVASDAIISR